MSRLLQQYFSVLAGEDEAAYLSARRHGTGMDDRRGASPLDVKAEVAKRMLSSCRFCERRCGADRAGGMRGVCGVGSTSFVSSEFLHLGEEPELVPSHTIFFSGCTFKCVYCQNFDIATRPDEGRPVGPEMLARAVKARQAMGARNVNVVGGDPTPHIHTLLGMLRDLDVNTPIVFNTNMYMSDEAMRLLDGVIDVYLADFRYGNDDCAKRYSFVDRYWDVVTRNLRAANEQAEIMLRHLVLPGHLDCCTDPIMAWVAERLPGVYFNLMFQYRPCHRAYEYPEMDRSLTAEEQARAIELAEFYGIVRR
jgi:putative pyruvate formate lyase activating enzyme